MWRLWPPHVQSKPSWTAEHRDYTISTCSKNFLSMSMREMMSNSTIIWRYCRSSIRSRRGWRSLPVGLYMEFRLIPLLWRGLGLRKVTCRRQFWSPVKWRSIGVLNIRLSCIVKALSTSMETTRRILMTVCSFRKMEGNRRFLWGLSGLQQCKWGGLRPKTTATPMTSSKYRK